MPTLMTRHETAADTEPIEDTARSSLAGLTRETKKSVEGEKKPLFFFFFKKSYLCEDG